MCRKLGETLVDVAAAKDYSVAGQWTSVEREECHCTPENYNTCSRIVEGLVEVNLASMFTVPYSLPF